MRKLYILIISILISSSLSAQERSPMNIDLFRRLEQLEKENRSNELIALIVKGDLNYIQSETERRGGHYKFGVKNIASIELSAKEIRLLAQSPNIDRMAALQQKGVVLNDVMTIKNNADSVHFGYGLPTPFKGGGVIMGIIDTDLSWLHPDFQHANGDTRVRYLWDQTYDSTVVVAPYNYGVDWDSSDINNNNCPYRATLAHGTHVAGIATGNGGALNGKYHGIAPQSDIVFVRIDENSLDFMQEFVDAVNYIFAKADALGMPCVINSSVGSYYGSHDGTDLWAEAVDAMLDAKPGRFLSQAAGNARGYQMHLRHEPTPNFKHSWLRRNNSTGYADFFLFADTAALNHDKIRFSLLDGNNVLTVLGSTREYDVLADFDITENNVDTLEEVLFYDNATPITLKVYGTMYNGVYEMWWRIETTSNFWSWYFETKGTGVVDCWADPNIYGTGNFGPVFAPPADFILPDDEQTIVSSWACSPKVLTVGSYNNREYFVNFVNDTIWAASLQDYPNELSKFSSRGMTRDGRLKPEICATGGFMISCLPVEFMANYQQNSPTYLAQEGMHTLNGGTSMAAPVGAGAAALFLDCDPDATYSEIINAITTTAKVDIYVQQQGMNIPNLDWGYGKLDIYQAIKKCVHYGCTNPIAVNYDSTANFDDSTCIILGTPNQPNFKATCLVQPNPAQQSTSFNYELPANLLNPKIVVYDALGRVLKTILLNTNSGICELDLSTWPAGVYIYQLSADGEMLNSGKLVKH